MVQMALQLQAAHPMQSICCQPAETGLLRKASPDSKVHGANMGPIWGRQDPGGPHVGPINFAIWEGTIKLLIQGASKP